MGHSRQTVLQVLEDTGVVAVVRADDPTGLTRLAAALRDGGVRLVEITMTVPGALNAIEAAATELGDDVFVGAGTVLDAVTARQAISSGASFIVGPSLDLDVVKIAHLYGVAVIPGCLTPTEIATAWAGGADAIKLFPGRVATPEYFGDLRGPFPQVKMLPTGNVDLQTTPRYIEAGAIAVGVGKALVDPAALRDKDWARVSENARSFRAVVDQAKGATK